MRMSHSPISTALKGPANDVTQLSSGERPGARLVGFWEVQYRIGLSRSTVWRLEKSNQFPKSIRICSGRRAWLESAIDDWIASKAGAEGDNHVA